MRKGWPALFAVASITIAIAVMMLGPWHSTPAASDGSFTIIVLPDTQKYSRYFPEIFSNQTRWIAAHAKDMRIAFVIYEGDIVDRYNSTEEWENANASMSILDGVVPYSVLPGNHDMPTTLFNRYLPPGRFSGYPWYGGNFSGNDNSYYLFDAGGQGYVVISLGFCPGNGTIAWANAVLRSQAARRAIIVTHGYLDTNSQRYVHLCGSTQYIWDSLAARNDNVFLMLSGHFHGEAQRSDRSGNRTVIQLLADYQEEENGGNGWLRIMEFHPDKGYVQVMTYSPYLNRFRTGAGSQFEFGI